MYHLPMTRGAGWSWGPRDADKAFGVGVGVTSYASVKGWDRREEKMDSAPKEAWPSTSRTDDIEAGTHTAAAVETRQTAGGGERQDRVYREL